MGWPVGQLFGESVVILSLGQSVILTISWLVTRSLGKLYGQSVVWLLSQ